MKEKDVVRWKIEAITLIFIVISIFFSFYLTFLSFQTVDEALRKQLVAFAASFLITGITILAVLMVHLGIKKAFLRIEDSARSKIKTSTHKEG